MLLAIALDPQLRARAGPQFARQLLQAFGIQGLAVDRKQDVAGLQARLN